MSNHYLAPPLQLPSIHDLHAYRDKWTKYIDGLDMIWNAYKDMDFKESIRVEREEKEDMDLQTRYGTDADRLIIALADKSHNWREMEASEEDLDELTCYNKDTCWFQGNLDRRGEYDVKYTLKGTASLDPV